MTTTLTADPRTVLYVFRMTGQAAERTGVAAWRPRVPGVSEVFHARFTTHAYPLHTHQTWTLLILDEGAVS